MTILLLAALVLGIWLVLDYFRKQQLMKEIIGLQRQALEKGVDTPSLDALLRRLGSRDLSLRVGILSLCVGGALVAVTFLIPGSVVDAEDAILVFRIIGILAGALGIGNLAIWFLIDRPKR